MAEFVVFNPVSTAGGKKTLQSMEMQGKNKTILTRVFPAFQRTLITWAAKQPLLKTNANNKETQSEKNTLIPSSPLHSKVMETLSIQRIAPPHRFRSMEFEFRSDSPNSGGGFYFSAPTSPTRSAAILSDFAKSIRAVVPFGWEEKPGTPKKHGGGNQDGGEQFGDEFSEDDGDFEFCTGFVVSEERRKSENSGLVVSTAEELFSNGQIRPLRLPPRLQKSFDFEKTGRSFSNWGSSKSLSPRSPLKEGQRIVKEALWKITGRREGGDFDPFAAAMKETAEEERWRRREGFDRSPGRRIGRSCSPLGSFNCGRGGDGREFKSEGKSGRRRSLKEFLIRNGRRGWSFLVALAPPKHLKKQQPYISIANQIQYRIG